MKSINLEYPTLVICAGSPAIGKTTLAKKLSENITDSFFLDRDQFVDVFSKRKTQEKKGDILFLEIPILLTANIMV